MPTIFPPTQSPTSTPSTPQPNLVGPRVVLPNMTTPVPAASAPAVAPVVESAPAPVPPVVPVAEVPSMDATDTENIHEVLSEIQLTEQQVLDELADLRSQQSGIMSQVKSLVEKTGLVETKESALEKQLLTLQEQRDQLQQSIPPTASIAPQQPAPAPTPAAVVKPPVVEDVIQPLTTAEILAKLQSAFSESSPELAALLQPGAQVYITGDHALLVEHAERTVLFSSEDVTAAGLSDAQLTMLPQKSTQHLPPVADVEAHIEAAPAEPSVESAVTPVVENVDHTDLIEKLLKNGTAEIIALVKQNPTILRASTGNGIAIVVGTERIVVPDAELLRYGVTGPDVIGLAPEAAQPVPHVSEV